MADFEPFYQWVSVKNDQGKEIDSKFVFVLNETDKAWLVMYAHERQWIPKSQTGTKSPASCPEWLWRNTYPGTLPVIDQDESGYNAEKKNDFEVWVPKIGEVFRVPGLMPEAGSEEAETRKKQIFYQIEKSPTPDSVKKLQRWATTTDDIQDYLVSAEVAGKIGARVARRWAPRVASKILSKFTPIVGWVLLANDALNAATAGLSAASGPMAAKRAASAFIGIKKGGLRGRYRWAGKIADLSTHWRDWIQVAQASEDLTGFGLRLGSVMGFLTDAFYGTARGAELMMPWERPTNLEWKALWAMKAAREQGEYVKYLGPEETARNWLTIEDAMITLHDYSRRNPWPKNVNATRQNPVPTHAKFTPVLDENGYVHKDPEEKPKQVTDSTSKKVLQDMGIDPEEDVGFIAGPNPTGPTIGDIVDAPKGEEGNQMLNSIMYHYDDWKMRMAHDAITKNADAREAIFATDPNEYDEMVLESDEALVRSYEWSLFPPEDTSIDAMQQAYDQVGNYIKLHGKEPDYEKMKEILVANWGNVCTSLPCR